MIHLKIKIISLNFDKYVIVVGETQVQKSCFIICITDSRKCKIGNGVNSCTIEPNYITITKNDFNFSFVDTPGLNDGNGDINNIYQLNSIKKNWA